MIQESVSKVKDTNNLDGDIELNSGLRPGENFSKSF